MHSLLQDSWTISGLNSSNERDSKDVASEHFKHAWVGRKMKVLEVKETACARADEKPKGGGRGKQKRGGALKDITDVLSPVCRFVS